MIQFSFMEQAIPSLDIKNNVVIDLEPC